MVNYKPIPEWEGPREECGIGWPSEQHAVLMNEYNGEKIVKPQSAKAQSLHDALLKELDRITKEKEK